MPHGARWQGGIGVSPELSESLGLSSSDIPRNLRNGLRSVLLRPRELLGTDGHHCQVAYNHP